MFESPAYVHQGVVNFGVPLSCGKRIWHNAEMNIFGCMHYAGHTYLFKCGLNVYV